MNNVNHGIFLERWLDIYLGRETERVHTRPGFLSDPDLMIQPAAQAERYFSSPDRDPEQSFEVETAETDEHAAAGDGQSLRASTISALDSITRKYSSLPQEAQDLDVILFNTLYTIVKGTMKDVIGDLHGPDARYTFAVCAMWQHMGYSASSRRLDAMSKINELSYHGDPGQ